MRHHVREGHLQYLHQLQADLAGDEDIEPEVVAASKTEDYLARNDSISCKLGIRYPVLQAILSGRKNHQSLMVRIYLVSYTTSYTTSHTRSYTMSCSIYQIIIYYSVYDIVYDVVCDTP